MSISRKALYFGLKSTLSNKLVTGELVLKWEKESYKTFNYYLERDEFHTLNRSQAMGLKNVLLLEYGIDLPEHKLMDIVNECWRYFIKNCKLYEDVVPMLSQLAQDGYKLGLITDSDEENVTNILRRHNLNNMFKIKVISSVLKTYKPNLLLFKRALELAKCSLQELIYIGDTMNDIYGAKQLGLITIVLCRNKTQDSVVEIEPDFKIDNLYQLPSILTKLRSKVS